MLLGDRFNLLNPNFYVLCLDRLVFAILGCVNHK